MLTYTLGNYYERLIVLSLSLYTLKPSRLLLGIELLFHLNGHQVIKKTYKPKF